MAAAQSQQLASAVVTVCKRSSLLALGARNLRALGPADSCVLGIQFFDMWTRWVHSILLGKHRLSLSVLPAGTMHSLACRYKGS